MHTAEHILNRTMVNRFGCPRSRNTHIERKKSKCDYLLSSAPTDEQIAEIEHSVNAVIDRHLPVTSEYMSHEEAAALVRIGDYDACACIGQHVSNTSEVGHFKIISHDYENGRLRLRFKLI